MKKTIELKGVDLQTLLGVADSNIRLLQDTFAATILIRGSKMTLEGNEQDIELTHEIIYEMIQTLSRKGSLTKKDVLQLIKIIRSDNNHSESVPDQIIHYGKKGAIIPRTEGQEKYAKLCKQEDIVFSIGPAGTGKTFLAVAFAVAALENHDMDRIVLCRPAVEAGESLGFLPGDLREKVDPYLTPLYDALNGILPGNKLKPLMQKNIIEVIPLAYMRGRTLDSAFMILDEAQNATPMQMKMFLTRLGVNSKAIITGDITQIDLPKRDESGLIDVLKVLRGVDGIGFVTLNESDVVRHKLVRDIIKAYDKTNGK